MNFPRCGCVWKSEALAFGELIAFKLSFQGFHYGEKWGKGVLS